ncbi:mediator of RNA polymerase II transcription subunit 15-like [Cyclospora cayetanensis]|uniref:Mediator of RNA polymerase II transcription subunit 15-like n=1 Tax=Cyclospora cayetanensis TaxID=88456 RepID=A0A6P6RZG3_9EIME|nr:mediator of RNA polymerase II transcription subunit 15-like [Cyclospora cayetanensis]
MVGGHQHHHQLQQLLRFFDLPPTCRCRRTVRMRYLLLAKQRHPDQQPAARAAVATADFALLQCNYERLQDLLAEERSRGTPQSEQGASYQQQWEQRGRQSDWQRHQQHHGAAYREQWWYQQRQEQRQRWEQWEDQQRGWQQQQTPKWGYWQQQQQQQQKRFFHMPIVCVARGFGLAFGLTAAYWLTAPVRRSARRSNSLGSSSNGASERRRLLQQQRQQQRQQQLHQFRMRKQNSLAESRRDQLHRHMHPMSGEGEASFSSVRGIGGDIKKKRRQSSGSQPSVVATRPVVEAAFSDTLADKAFSDGEISSGGSASLPRDPRAWREELVRIGHLVQQLHTDAEGSSSTYGSSVALQSEEPWLSDTPLAGGSSSRHGNAAGRRVYGRGEEEAFRRDPQEPQKAAAGPAEVTTVPPCSRRSKSAGNVLEKDAFYATRYIHRGVRVMRRRSSENLPAEERASETDQRGPVQQRAEDKRQLQGELQLVEQQPRAEPPRNMPIQNTAALGTAAQTGAPYGAALTCPVARGLM